MGNRLDSSNDQFKLYKLNMLAAQVQSAQLSDQRPVESFTADPCNSQGSDPGSIMYKCRKCRRPLFKSSSKLPHQEGKGEMAFDWRSSQCTDVDMEKDEVVCSKSIFIEPVQWI